MRRRLPTLILCGFAFACTNDPLPPPHLILITADALRADHLSGFGYPRATSPALDAFAERAWSFREAITVIPKTAPAFATLFSGRHPRQHGVGHNFARIPAAAPMLAETLKAEGYRTAAFVNNPALRRANGFARGFDLYHEVERSGGIPATLEAYLSWSAKSTWDEPTFLWVHFIDPHGPYDPPARYEALFMDDDLAQSDARVPGGYDTGDTSTPNKLLGAIPRYQQRPDGEDRVAAYVARYDAEIRYLDDAFAYLLSDLEAHDRTHNAVVVFSSDHGESLGEHDYYFEHGWFAHDATLRIPLFIRTPGQTEGRRVEDPASTLDLRPTLLRLLGITDPDPGAGRDLLGDPPDPPAVVVENGDEYPHKTLGIRTAGWKYLRTDDHREELYDLRADPGETRDRSAAEPAIREELAATLARRLSRLRDTAYTRGGETRDDEATLRRLRELGYVK